MADETDPNMSFLNVLEKVKALGGGIETVGVVERVSGTLSLCYKAVFSVYLSIQ